MGKYIRHLSDAVFTIASDDLWIESLAIQQLHTATSCRVKTTNRE